MSHDRWEAWGSPDYTLVHGERVSSGWSIWKHGEPFRERGYPQRIMRFPDAVSAQLYADMLNAEAEAACGK